MSPPNWAAVPGDVPGSMNAGNSRRRTTFNRSFILLSAVSPEKKLRLEPNYYRKQISGLPL